jgi:hypothetical protein
MLISAAVIQRDWWNFLIYNGPEAEAERQNNDVPINTGCPEEEQTEFMNAFLHRSLLKRSVYPASGLNLLISVD